VPEDEAAVVEIVDEPAVIARGAGSDPGRPGHGSECLGDLARPGESPALGEPDGHRVLVVRMRVLGEHRLGLLDHFWAASVAGIE
jgi:hypothetical protein